MWQRHVATACFTQSKSREFKWDSKNNQFWKGEVDFLHRDYLHDVEWAQFHYVTCGKCFQQNFWKPGSGVRCKGISEVWHSRQGLEKWLFHYCFQWATRQKHFKYMLEKKKVRDHAANPAKLWTMAQNTPLPTGKRERQRICLVRPCIPQVWLTSVDQDCSLKEFPLSLLTCTLL